LFSSILRNSFPFLARQLFRFWLVSLSFFSDQYAGITGYSRHTNQQKDEK